MAAKHHHSVYVVELSRDVLSEPRVWPGLKRALKFRRAQIQTLESLVFGAAALKLSTTHRILQNLLFYIPFAIIVLFREPIRKALASLGSAFFMPRGSTELRHLLARETAIAAFALAHQKQGALIVFERTQGLKDFADTGVKLNAEVTASLRDGNFNLLTGICQFRPMRKLVVAPFELLNRMLQLIEREITNTLALLGLVSFKELTKDYLCAVDPLGPCHEMSTFAHLPNGRLV